MPIGFAQRVGERLRRVGQRRGGADGQRADDAVVGESDVQAGAAVVEGDTHSSGQGSGVRSGQGVGCRVRPMGNTITFANIIQQSAANH